MIFIIWHSRFAIWALSFRRSRPARLIFDSVFVYLCIFSLSFFFFLFSLSIFVYLSLYQYLSTFLHLFVSSLYHPSSGDDVYCPKPKAKQQRQMAISSFNMPYFCVDVCVGVCMYVGVGVGVCMCMRKRRERENLCDLQIEAG